MKNLTADPVGPVQNIFFPIVHNFKLSVPIVQLAGPTGRQGPQSPCVSGGASLPAQELTDRSLYNIITHKRLSPCQTFSGSLDADSIYMALNKTCPRFHFHTGNNETPITLSGITV
jgi:hypothetical protein